MQDVPCGIMCKGAGGQYPSGGFRHTWSTFLTILRVRFTGHAHITWCSCLL
jgi:hypothetical protein